MLNKPLIRPYFWGGYVRGGVGWLAIKVTRLPRSFCRVSWRDYPSNGWWISSSWYDGIQPVEPPTRFTSTERRELRDIRQQQQQQQTTNNKQRPMLRCCEIRVGLGRPRGRKTTPKKFGQKTTAKNDSKMRGFPCDTVDGRNPAITSWGW